MPMEKSLSIVHPHAAGIDIGSKSFFVDSGEDEGKKFFQPTPKDAMEYATIYSAGV